MKFWSRSKKNIDIEDILSGANNISEMDSQQFEGVIEKPLSLMSYIVPIIVIAIIFVLFIFRLTIVQIVKHDSYAHIAEENRLDKVPLFAARGTVSDRNGELLAWNDVDQTVPFLRRHYREMAGLSHLLGFIRYPATDDKGVYWRLDTEGVGGIEEQLNSQLKGNTGYQLTESRGDTKTDSAIVVRPVDGANITITIDSRYQEALGNSLHAFMTKHGYQAAGAVVMDVRTSDIIALVSLPDFDANKVVSGDSAYMSQLLSDPRNPFLNRVTKGLFTPGSIIKPFVAYQALHENIITKDSTVFSNGRITIPNPYNPENPSIFRDWRPQGHGVTNVEFALADSVNTFFYAISGGYGNQKGMGIDSIELVSRQFGFGEPVEFLLPTKTKGTIPTPEWKRKTFKESWRLGDTYISAVGQYGFQVTPLQMVRAVGAIANGGILLEPRLLPSTQISQKDLSLDSNNLAIVQSGMRMTVTDGTAQMLNIANYTIAAKTGSAQVGIAKDRMNSWIIGYYPYENPQYAFVLLVERGPKTGAPNVGWALRDALLLLQTPEPVAAIDSEL
jgi:penicillin-binding protein 2